MNEYNPDQASHPGETLQDLLEESGVSVTELAERMGCEAEAVRAIVSGRADVTPEVAILLARSLDGPPARFWVKRQEAWDAITELAG